MAEADRPWPGYLYMSFSSAIANDVDDGIGEGDFATPSFTLLTAPGPMTLNLSSGVRAFVDFVPVVLVEVNRHPGFS